MNEPYYREKLISEAIALWKKHGSEYRVLLDNYYYLLELKRALIETGQMRKISLEPIKKSSLKEYPVIKFLDYCSESDAMHYIKLLDNGKIFCIIREIEEFDKSSLTQTLRAKVYDYNHQIQHRDTKKSLFALDPEACKGGGKHTRPTRLSYSESV